jgi:flavin reductase (DIM6/NTAB) family NADH-FMN oxidoreductase RutF
MVKVTDYVGMKSGKQIDKSLLFDVFYGELKTAPMINEAPLIHECKLVEILDLGGTNEIFIGEIMHTYIDENCLENGRPDIRKLRPILFSGYNNNYLEIGNDIGQAYKIGKDYEKK